MTHGKSVLKKEYICSDVEGADPSGSSERIRKGCIKFLGSGKQNFTDPDAIKKNAASGLRTGVSDLKEA
jgi:hypothetical protein